VRRRQLQRVGVSVPSPLSLVRLPFSFTEEPLTSKLSAIRIAITSFIGVSFFCKLVFRSFQNLSAANVSKYVQNFERLHSVLN
jgi:hypothetical protein